MGMGMMSDPQRDSCVAVALLLACFPGVCFGQCRDVTLNLTSITAPASTTICLSDCNWDTYLVRDPLLYKPRPCRWHAGA